MTKEDYDRLYQESQVRAKISDYLSSLEPGQRMTEDEREGWILKDVEWWKRRFEVCTRNVFLDTGWVR